MIIITMEVVESVCAQNNSLIEKIWDIISAGAVSAMEDLLKSNIKSAMQKFELEIFCNYLQRIYDKL